MDASGSWTSLFGMDLFRTTLVWYDRKMARERDYLDWQKIELMELMMMERVQFLAVSSALFMLFPGGPCHRTLLVSANRLGYTLPFPFVPSALAYRTPLDVVQQEGYGFSDRRPRPPKALGCRVATILGMSGTSNLQLNITFARDHRR
jgi:hypothetical protein